MSDRSPPGSPVWKRQKLICNGESKKRNDLKSLPKSSLQSISSSPLSFSLVTMNVAGCQPSKMAPSSWTQRDSEVALAKEIIQHNPDIVALQEFPGSALGDQTIMSNLFPSYRLIGYQTSHAPYVVLLVHEKWKAKEIQTNIIPASEFDAGLPAVMAEIELPLNRNNSKNEQQQENVINTPESLSQRRLWIASVHLEPFAEGARIRQCQLQALTSQARNAGIPLIVAGDTNMRVSEDSVPEEKMGLVDLWKLTGSDWGSKYTWNTRNELDQGGCFNQFYGRNTREYIARYDRIYAAAVAERSFQGSNRRKKSNNYVIEAESFSLIANRPIGESKCHFLSDHFGIACKFRLSSN